MQPNEPQQRYTASPSHGHGHGGGGRPPARSREQAVNNLAGTIVERQTASRAAVADREALERRKVDTARCLTAIGSTAATAAAALSFAAARRRAIRRAQATAGLDPAAAASGAGSDGGPTSSDVFSTASSGSDADGFGPNVSPALGSGQYTANASPAAVGSSSGYMAPVAGDSSDVGPLPELTSIVAAARALRRSSAHVRHTTQRMVDATWAVRAAASSSVGGGGGGQNSARGPRPGGGVSAGIHVPEPLSHAALGGTAAQLRRLLLSPEPAVSFGPAISVAFHTAATLVAAAVAVMLPFVAATLSAAASLCSRFGRAEEPGHLVPIGAACTDTRSIMGTAAMLTVAAALTLVLGRASTHRAATGIAASPKSVFAAPLIDALRNVAGDGAGAAAPAAAAARGLRSGPLTAYAHALRGVADAVAHGAPEAMRAGASAREAASAAAAFLLAAAFLAARAPGAFLVVAANTAVLITAVLPAVHSLTRRARKFDDGWRSVEASVTATFASDPAFFAGVPWGAAFSSSAAAAASGGGERRKSSSAGVVHGASRGSAYQDFALTSRRRWWADDSAENAAAAAGRNAPVEMIDMKAGLPGSTSPSARGNGNGSSHRQLPSGYTSATVVSLQSMIAPELAAYQPPPPPWSHADRLRARMMHAVHVGLAQLVWCVWVILGAVVPLAWVLFASETGARRVEGSHVEGGAALEALFGPLHGEELRIAAGTAVPRNTIDELHAAAAVRADAVVALGFAGVALVSLVVVVRRVADATRRLNGLTDCAVGLLAVESLRSAVNARPAATTANGSPDGNGNGNNNGAANATGNGGPGESCTVATATESGVWRVVPAIGLMVVCIGLLGAARVFSGRGGQPFEPMGGVEIPPVVHCTVNVTLPLKNPALAGTEVREFPGAARWPVETSTVWGALPAASVVVLSPRVVIQRCVFAALATANASMFDAGTAPWEFSGVFVATLPDVTEGVTAIAACARGGFSANQSTSGAGGAPGSLDGSDLGSSSADSPSAASAAQPRVPVELTPEPLALVLPPTAATAASSRTCDW